MAEREDLEVELRAIERLTKREDQRNDDREHESSLFDAERTFNQRTAYPFLVGTRSIGSPRVDSGSQRLNHRTARNRRHAAALPPERLARAHPTLARQPRCQEYQSPRSHARVRRLAHSAHRSAEHPVKFLGQ
jgi:hypothetical protein